MNAVPAKTTTSNWERAVHMLHDQEEWLAQNGTEIRDAFPVTPGSQRGPFEIWSYIAADSPQAADRVENAIYKACAFVASGHCADRRGKI